LLPELFGGKIGGKRFLNLVVKIKTFFFKPQIIP